MECPGCGYQPKYSGAQCPQCQRTFPVSLLEQREALLYTKELIEGLWNAGSLLSRLDYDALHAEVVSRLSHTEDLLGARAAAPPRPVTPAAPRPAAPATPPPAQPAAPAPAAPPIATPQPRPPAPPPQMPPAPAVPPEIVAPKPQFKMPEVHWGQVWLSLLSERAIRAYYIAAAVMLASVAALLVAVYWDQPLVPFLILLGIAPAFYIGGALIRQRPGYRIAGSSLLALGNLAVPVLLLSLTRLPAFHLGNDGVWLLTSAVAAPVYAVVARQLRDEASLYLLLVALGSLVWSLFSLDSWSIPGEWRIVPVAALGVPYLIASRRLKARDALGNAQRALYWTAHVGVAALGAFALSRLADPAASRAAVATTLWVAGGFYLYHYQIARRWESEYPALVVPAVAIFLTLFALDVDLAWSNLALACLALAYLVYGRVRKYAMKDLSWDNPQAALLAPGYVLAAISLVASLAWPLQQEWSRVATLYVDAATLTLAAWMFRNVVLETFGLAFLPLALSLHLWAAGVPVGWLNVALAGTAALFMLHAQYLRPLLYAGIEGSMGSRVRLLLETQFGASPQAAQTVLRPFGQPAHLLAYALVIISLAWPQQTELSRIVTLYTVSGTFAFSAWAFRSDVWAALGAAGLFASLWLTLARYEMAPQGQNVVFAALAAVYVLFGEALALRQRVAAGIRAGLTAPTARPFLGAGYLLAFFVVVKTSADLIVPGREGFAALAYLVVVALAVGSAVMRRSRLFVHVAAWLFAAPFGLASAQGFYVGLHFRAAEHALNVAVLAVAYLGVAATLDLRARRYAAPVHLAAQVLALVALGWFAGAVAENGLAFDESLQGLGAKVLGVLVAFYGASMALAHVGRRPSYAALASRLFPQAQGGRTWTNALFLYPTVWLGMGLALLLLGYLRLTWAQYGMALAALAPVLVAAGVLVRRMGLSYEYAFYSSGYFASAMGPLVAAADFPLRAASLGLTTGLYGASAYVFRQQAFAYLTAGLLPVLEGLLLRLGHVPVRFAGLWLFALLPLYLGLGLGLGRGWRLRLAKDEGIGRFGLPFLTVGYLVSAVGLALAAGQERNIAMAAFGMASLTYGLSAYLLRQPLFLYPAAATLVVPYYLGLTYTRLDFQSYGLALMPGVAVYALVGLRWAGASLVPWRRGALRFSLESPATPFLALAILGSVVAPALWHRDTLTLAATLGAVALLYGYAAWVLRRGLLLYPALLAAHLGYLAGAAQLGVDLASWRLAYLLIPDVAVMQAAAYLAGRRTRSKSFAWTAPFHTFVVAATGAMLLAPLVDYQGSALAAALWATAGVTAYHAWRDRQPVWLYAVLGTAHLAYVVLWGWHGFDLASSGLAYLLVPGAYLMQLGGLFVSKARGLRGPSISLESWSLPLHVFAAVDLLAATAAGQFSPGTGLTVGLAFFGLAAITFWSWRWRTVLIGVALAFLGLAYAHALWLAGVRAVDSPSYSAVVALALTTLSYAAGPLVARLQKARASLGLLALWLRPLRTAALALPALAVLAMVIAAKSQGFGHDQALHLSVAFLAVAVLALERSWLDRSAWMGYAGGILALSGLTTLLATWNIGQPQAYLVPWGMYVIAAGIRERYWGYRPAGRYLEAAGILGILGMTQAQLFVEGARPDLWGLNDQALFYILLGESLLVLVQANLRRVKYPFYTGLVFLLLNLGLTVYDQTRDVDKLLLLGVLGAVLFALAVFLERKREVALRKGRDLLKALERWD